MLKIPGIDAEKVELYGKRFLGLIKTTKQSFQAMMEQNEDRPQDPNHMVVINISDEDDMGNSYMDDFDDDGSPRERSTYFPSREVEAWNAQCKSFDPGCFSLDIDSRRSLAGATSTECSCLISDQWATRAYWSQLQIWRSSRPWRPWCISTKRRPEQLPTEIIERV